MRNALAHAGKQGRRVVSAFIATAFAQEDAAAATAQWRQVADQLRKRHVDGTLLAGGRCAESGGLMNGLAEVSGERALESISYEHS